MQDVQKPLIHIEDMPSSDHLFLNGNMIDSLEITYSDPHYIKSVFFTNHLSFQKILSNKNIGFLLLIPFYVGVLVIQAKIGFI